MSDSVVECVVEAIKRIAGNRIRDLSVQYCDGRLRLRGRSRTFYGKQLVNHAVKTLGLPFQLENEIEVVDAIRRPDPVAQ